MDSSMRRRLLKKAIFLQPVLVDIVVGECTDFPSNLYNSVLVSLFPFFA